MINKSHGEGANGRETAEYRAWSQMKTRCQNPKHVLFSEYGGRGIVVCARWGRYEHFLADMGRRPSDSHSLDRIDNSKGYSPENCRWATWVQQNNNRREDRGYVAHQMAEVEIDGVTQSVSKWLLHYGLRGQTYRMRLRRGMSPAEALQTGRLKPGRKHVPK